MHVVDLKYWEKRTVTAYALDYYFNDKTQDASNWVEIYTVNGRNMKIRSEPASLQRKVSQGSISWLSLLFHLHKQ